VYAAEQELLRALYEKSGGELAETVVRPQTWNLTLTGLGENEMKNLVLSYPPRLFPCN